MQYIRLLSFLLITSLNKEYDFCNCANVITSGSDYFVFV